MDKYYHIISVEEITEDIINHIDGIFFNEEKYTEKQIEIIDRTAKEYETFLSGLYDEPNAFQKDMLDFIVWNGSLEVQSLFKNNKGDFCKSLPYFN